MEQKTNLPSYFSTFSSDTKRVISEFKYPILNNVFFNNLQILRENSDYILFDQEKWIMRPEVFSNDYYNEPYYSHVILIVNNIKSIFEFKPENLINRVIIAPYKKQITKLISYSIQ